jgi:hypothetical protein
MDNRVDTNLFPQWLATQSVELSIWAFLLDFILAVGLSYLLAWVYRRYGRALSNREAFSKNFWPLTAATMLVITIVKSSLALSLGLVGALSIVRFRTAIKEPEELLYLFFCIAIGVGFGADQSIITGAAIICVMVLLALFNLGRSTEDAKNLVIAITSKAPGPLSLTEMSAVLGKHCAVVNLKRFDEDDEKLEASFMVEIQGFEKLTLARDELRSLDDAAKITFIDNKGIF